MIFVFGNGHSIGFDSRLTTTAIAERMVCLTRRRICRRRGSSWERRSRKRQRVNDRPVQYVEVVTTLAADRRS
jgi:hypothetical protein